jgi:septal ring factor EnvC (AmiA/AmiB activator)
VTRFLPLLLICLAPLAVGLGLAAPALSQSSGTARLDGLAVAQARDGLAAEAQRRRLEDLSRQEAALAGDLARRRGELSRLLGALAAFRQRPPPALLVPPERARDAVRGAILARALTPELTGRARVLSSQLQQVAVLRREAAAANESLLNAQSALAERSVMIAQALQERAPTGPYGAAPLGDDGGALRLLWPVSGKVARRFGDTLSGGGKAQGLSVAAARGDPVLSPASGEAQYVGAVPGWGIVLILKIKGAYHLVLGGLEEVSVQNGQSVSAGDAVGRLPKGARSTPELYMEVRENGAPVDPARWLSGAPLGVSPQ